MPHSGSEDSQQVPFGFQSFCMESARSVIVSLQPGDLLDIKKAYLHILLLLSHQYYLYFSVNVHHYQFVALPFWPVHSTLVLHQDVCSSLGSAVL